MIPKIEFRYSWIYDTKNNFKETSLKKILNYTKLIEKKWAKIGNKILIELQNISGLQWEEKIIICYIVTKTIPFSDPLTIPIYESKKYNKDYFIDVLVHELIHRLFTQKENKKISGKSWKKIEKKFKNENKKVVTHIVLNAIHKHILLKFFNKKRLKINIKALKHLKDYRRAWDIVEKQGYKFIINFFKKI